jgi:CBS-domain-containing membrane protein
LPVVDSSDQLVGMLHRTDLLKASTDATAAQLARPKFPICYADEIVHDVALRVIDGGERVCPVLDRDTGSLVGIVTAFDFLKAKQWETMQEIPQPGRLSVFSLLRVRSKTATSSSEQEREDAAHETVQSGR